MGSEKKLSLEERRDALRHQVEQGERSLQNLAIQVQQLKGAIAMLNELLREEEESTDGRDDPSG